MRRRVPQLRGLQVGLNVVEDERAWDMAVVASFDDPAALAAFQSDPDHRRVKDSLAPFIREAATVDFHEAVGDAST